MKTQITSFAAVAITIFAAPAFAQSAPDPIRTDSLMSIARTFGNRAGNIETTSSSGATQILAYGMSSYVVYTAGDGITTADNVVFCVEDATGGLSSCAAPNSTAYHCEQDCTGNNCDGWCECSSILDCVAMLLSGECSESLDCDTNGCACTNS